MKKLFKGRAGFTLIELLVVVAVIAILAAILYPVFSQARDKARQAGCQSNLKQIGLAFDMYRQDYDGSFPRNRFPGAEAGAPIADDNKDEEGLRPYYAELYPYVKNYSLFICPARGKGFFGHQNPKKALSHEGREDCYLDRYARRLGEEPEFFGRVSYGYNQRLWGAREVEIANATRLPMLFDANTIFPWVTNASDPTGGVQTPQELGGTHEGHPDEGIQPGKCLPLHWAPAGCVMRHVDGLNILFADGHVKFVAWREMHQPRYCLLPEHP
jgi:prepilin-type N-terminal cleavage/methylation domain-containing protein/prepilin-type processing-associated H-X9-DG protein